MRRLGIVAAVLAAFALVLALTFPTDAIVRALVARIPLPSGVTLAFADAHVGPRGLVLDDVHVTRPDGHALLDAAWLRLHPSLWGFWRDRTGRPWSITASSCQGTFTVGVGADGLATTVALTLENVELATCLPYVIGELDAYGRVDGTARLRYGGTDFASGDGAMVVRGAAWRPHGPFEDEAVKADMATVRWRLADGRFQLDTIDATSEDFRAVGAGSLRFTGSLGRSPLDVRLTVTPGRTMPPTLRRIVDGIPGAPADLRGARTFRLVGTLEQPQVQAIEAQG